MSDSSSVSASPSLPRPSVGVAVIVRRDGKYLFYKRRGSHAAGTWSVPGGHLEHGESWEDCARREVQEEIGVTLKNVHFIAATNDIMPDDGKHYISIWMEADIDQGEPISQEPEKVTELRWIDSLHNLPEPLFQPCWDNLRLTRPDLFE